MPMTMPMKYPMQAYLVHETAIATSIISKYMNLTMVVRSTLAQINLDIAAGRRREWRAREGIVWVAQYALYVASLYSGCDSADAIAARNVIERVGGRHG